MDCYLLNNIIILESIDDWKQSIKAASKPLVDKKNVLEKYVEIILRGLFEITTIDSVSKEKCITHHRI